ncbi:MAG: hypothetical protein ACM31E_06125 [Fibrobacterota bacterium]
MHPLIIIMSITALFSLVFLIATVRALIKFRFFSLIQNTILALLFTSLTATCTILWIANHGYRSLLQEECAATITVEPAGKQRFIARVVFPDGKTAEYNCGGDQVYVDAYILKWHPWLNIIGIHTGYQLERIGGRYISIDDEKNKPHTIHALSENPKIDMYKIRMRYVALKPLVDAEYGSATFIYAGLPAVFKVMVSTSGLLVRKEGDVL